MIMSYMQIMAWSFVTVYLSTTLYLQVHGQSTELEIYFAEVDFREIERQGAITATIIKEGPLMSDLFLNIIPLTYNEFDARGFDLAPERRLDRPDPAELRMNGRSDFNDSAIQIVLNAGVTSDDYSVSIPITRDSFNEASEGFMIVMRADETLSNVADLNNIFYQDNGVALGVIDDDDPIVFGFEQSFYSVDEGATTLSSLVSIIKQQDQITEQVISLVVNSFDITAETGVDYRAIGELTITFQPDVMSIPLPITLLDDDIPEPSKEFRLVISRLLNSPNLAFDIDNTIVNIVDTDNVEVGFNQTTYTVNEGDRVVVCVDLSGPEVIDDNLLVALTVSSGSGTANVDDFIILNSFLVLLNDVRQTCFTIQTLTDTILENTETVTIIIDAMPGITPGNVIISQTNATLIINSNECVENNNDCADDAQCVDTVEGFECICLEGFTGSGRTCPDVNECTENLDDCSSNANCINTVGSFECQCLDGFRGDGRICTDLNECNEDSNICGANAICINTIGSFTCRCINGFRLDGSTCVDINECDLDSCGINANCINTIGSFECQCLSGFRGDGRICTDINECTENLDDCDSDESCLNTIGSFQCSRCPIGFQSDGQLCIDINECAEGLDDCSPDANCINTVGSFECECLPTFEGDGRVCTAITLQPNLVNECDTEETDCSLIARCIDLVDGYECRCPAGYSGDGKICTDLNECDDGSKRCDYPHSQCVNVEGSYKCVCEPGYTPWGKMCMDINECTSGNNDCDDNAFCTNTAGSYICTCNDGFTGDGVTCTAEQSTEPLVCDTGFKPWGQRCVDINECSEGSDDCDDDAYCTNTAGSYRCTCAPGFTGDGFTCSVEQLSPPCVNLFGFDDGTSRTTGTGTRRTGTGTQSRTTGTGTRRTGTGTRSRTTGTHRTGTGTRKTGTGTQSRTGTTHTTRHSSRSRRWAQPPLCIPQLTFGDSSDGTSRTGTTTRASTRRSTQRSTTRRSTQRSTRRSTRKSTKGTRKGRSANNY